MLGVTGMLRHRKLVLAIAVLGVLWSGVWVSVTPPAIGSTFVLAAFAVGVAAWSYRDRIVLSWPIAGAVLVVSALAALGPMGPRVMVWTVAAVYLSYFVAYALPNVGRFVTRSGDASYGVYIWAFPIQQVIYQVLGPDIGPWTMIAIATPIVWVLAQLSWHLIESPALRHKPRRPGEAGPAAADTAAPVVDSGVRQSP